MSKCAVKYFIATTVVLLFKFTVINSAEAKPSNIGYYLQLYNYINSYRGKHVSPSMTWSRSLNEAAENLALQILLYPDSYHHSDLEYHGINYYRVNSAEKPSAALVVSTWYNETIFYDFNYPGYNSKSLNFTQLLWKSSTFLGVGMATLNDVTIVLADFDPPGNIRGKFKLNVFPLRKTIG